MKGTIEIPFAVGSQVWWVGPDYMEEYIICPDCCGTKVITMRLGNGDEHTIDCQLCAVGYDPPSGRVKKVTCGYTPTQLTLTSVGFSGEEPYYHTDALPGCCVYAKDLFLSRDECAARCEALRAEKQAWEDRCFCERGKKVRRDMSWSVSHWRRLANDLKKQLAAVERRLDVCRKKKEEDHSATK